MKTKSAKRFLDKKLKEKTFVKAYQEIEDLLRVGVTIAAAREKAGLSQAQLARKLHTTQSVISRIENGNQNLSLKMLAKIAKCLQCEVQLKIRPLKLAA